MTLQGKVVLVTGAGKGRGLGRIINIASVAGLGRAACTDLAIQQPQQV